MRKIYALVVLLVVGAMSAVAGNRIRPVTPESLKPVDFSKFGIELAAGAAQDYFASAKSAGARAENETWTDYGEARFHDGWILPAFGITPDIFDWPVPVQKSSLGERYKLIAPWHQEYLKLTFQQLGISFPFTTQMYDIIIDCTDPDRVMMDYQPGVVFKPGYLNDFSSVQVNLNTLHNMYLANGIAEEQIAAAGFVSKLVDGNIYIRSCCMGTDNQPVAQAGGAFVENPYDTRIELPGAKDYSFYSELTEGCVHADAATLKYEVSEKTDIAQVKYCAVAGDRYANRGNLFDSLEANGYMKVASASGTKVLPDGVDKLPVSVLVSVFVAAYNADGVRVANDVHAYIHHVDDSDNWTELGEGEFTEDLISSAYGDANGNTWGASTYKVKVLQHKERPGLYRIVNPYGSAWKHAAYNKHDATHDYYLNIDATDPAKVYIPYSFVGFDSGEGLGCDYLISYNAYVNEKNIDARLWGKLADGVVTMPAKSVYDFTTRDDSPYQVGTGRFKLVLPVAGVDGVSIDSDADAPVEYFNLQGVRLMNPAKGQLVIKRQGGTVTKEYVR